MNFDGIIGEIGRTRKTIKFWWCAGLRCGFRNF